MIRGGRLPGCGDNLKRLQVAPERTEPERVWGCDDDSWFEDWDLTDFLFDSGLQFQQWLCYARARDA
jgi:hypothetical protein